ncbi:outer membrane protein [Bacteroides sp. 519]|uniref:outer membrane protein n=1 Tax=Bacteroides sp. 519 TaxID=2302937 RepID=UPI0013D46CFE|nr:outer membrane beta-barrel protein [Bacteroides sp. 519]NDV59783.1 porin family protein [Bacteroides sp. 519]
MKKILFLVAFLATVATTYAQKGDLAVIGNIGYQTNYERFAIGAQSRYNLSDRFRLAPDVTFFFPKDKVTGVDINLNLHYVFDLNADNLTFYPLAGFGMQNNFYGKRTIAGVKIDSDTRTELAFNLGAGLTYNLSARSFLNVEGKFMFGDDDSGVFLIGYGWKF